MLILLLLSQDTLSLPFYDGFEGGLGNWVITTTYNGVVRTSTGSYGTGGALEGDSVMVLTCSAWGPYSTSCADVYLDLSGVTGIPVLSFYWRTWSLYGSEGEWVWLEVYDGEWHTIDSLTGYDPGWIKKKVNLGIYNPIKGLGVRFRACMDGTESWDAAYVDSVYVRDVPAGFIKGHVYDAKTGAPVSGAVVMSDVSFPDTTDASGAYLMYIAVGNTEVICTHPHYFTARESVEVTEGETLSLDIYLKRPEISLAPESLYFLTYPGRSDTQYISITNNGTDTLRFDIFRALHTGKLSIAVVGEGWNPAYSYPLLRDDDSLSRYFKFDFIGNGWTFEDLEGYDGVVVDNDDASITATEAEALVKFWRQGKGVVMGMDDLDEVAPAVQDYLFPIFGISGVFDASIDGGMTNPDHFISRDLDTIYSVSSWSGDAYTISDGTWLVKDTLGNIFAVAKEDTGRAVIFGQSIYSWLENEYENNRQIIRNAIVWATMGRPAWLSFPFSYVVVPPGYTLVLPVVVNTSGLPGGTYKAYGAFLHNVPGTSAVYLPVGVHVAAPAAVLPDSFRLSISPGEVKTGTLWVKNVGDYPLIYTLNEGISTKAVDTVFYDDMESGENDWGSYGLWHLTSHRYSSDTMSWYYGIEGVWNYDTGDANRGALTSPLIDLLSYSSATLSFSHFLECEGSPYEHGVVLISTDYGNTWDTLYQSDGTGGLWRNVSLDISPYCGHYVNIRFSFDVPDANYNDFEGWYVDDVMVTGVKADIPWLSFAPAQDTVPPQDSVAVQVLGDGSSITSDTTLYARGVFYTNDPSKETSVIPFVVEVSSPQDALEKVCFFLSSPVPNPASCEFSFRYGIPERTHVYLALYDISGRRVHVFENGEKDRGVYGVSYGGELPPGFYYIRLKTEKDEAIRKVLIVR